MRMIRLCRVVLLLLVGLPLVAGESTPQVLGRLLRGREKLGDSDWAAVLRLERADGGRAEEAALVFEFAGALWFYRPADGTQSLSQHWNNVATERHQLLELLRRIDPAYVAYREYSAAELAAVPPVAGALPNGCFIESVAEARRLGREAGVAEACLLSYYVRTADGLRGHTVLCYRDDAGSHLFDPVEGRAVKVRPVSLGEQALDLARLLVPSGLVRGLVKAAKIVLPRPVSIEPGGGRADSPRRTGSLR